MPPRLQAALLIFTAVLLWGFAPVGTRELVGDTRAALPAVPYIGLRYGISTLFFLPFIPAALRGWSRRDLALGALCGLVGVLGYNLPAAMGNRTASAGMVGLVNATEPLLIVLLASLRVRRLPRLASFGAAGIGLAGILLLTRAAGPAQGDVPGIALLLLASFDWALYCVLVPPLLARHSAWQVSAVTMLCGTLPMLAAGAPGLPHLLTAMTPAQWEILAGLAFGSSVIGMVAWNKGAAGLGPEASGWFLYLLPVVSVAGGAALLTEPLCAMELLGGFLILLSVFLSQRV